MADHHHQQWQEHAPKAVATAGITLPSAMLMLIKHHDHDGVDKKYLYRADDKTDVACCLILLHHIFRTIYSFPIGLQCGLVHIILVLHVSVKNSRQSSSRYSKPIIKQT